MRGISGQLTQHHCPECDLNMARFQRLGNTASFRVIPRNPTTFALRRQRSHVRIVSGAPYFSITYKIPRHLRLLAGKQGVSNAQRFALSAARAERVAAATQSDFIPSSAAGIRSWRQAPRPQPQAHAIGRLGQSGPLKCVTPIIGHGASLPQIAKAAVTALNHDNAIPPAIHLPEACPWLPESGNPRRWLTTSVVSASAPLA